MRLIVSMVLFVLLLLIVAVLFHFVAFILFIEKGCRYCDDDDDDEEEEEEEESIVIVVDVALALEIHAIFRFKMIFSENKLPSINRLNKKRKMQ